jgi:hypothetical protein
MGAIRRVWKTDGNSTFLLILKQKFSFQLFYLELFDVMQLLVWESWYGISMSVFIIECIKIIYFLKIYFNIIVLK